MQCNQSFGGNGFPNFGQCYPWNPPLQCTRPFPEIIGEGDVASVVLPDGNVQFFFKPTANWWMPVAGAPLANANNSYWNSNAGVWFIRTISNPIPSVAFNQQSQRNYGIPLPRPFITSDSNIPPLGFNLKFHNDRWTSTTDLHYFYPRLRPDWSKGSAAVQVELLPLTNTICHQEMICNRPCSFTTKPRVKETRIQCKCNEVVDTSSNMSIEDTKPKVEQKHKENRSKSKDSIKCQCEDTTKPNTIDKSVTTYTDQACGCTTKNGQETQTRENTSPVQSAKTMQPCSEDESRIELWTPKTRFSKGAMQPQCSHESVYVCERCSDSCSCFCEDHEV